MRAVLPRTGSVPAHLSCSSGSPRVSLCVHDSATGVFSGEKNRVSSPRISLHWEANRRGIRRSFSATDVIRSETNASDAFSRSSGLRSLSFASRIPEEECISDGDEAVGRIGSLTLSDGGCGRANYAGVWPESGIPLEEIVFPGGGVCNGGRAGGRGGGDKYRKDGFAGGHADRRKISQYYEEMLKSNPTNSLLLRNYGKFLHEVERDSVKAEEYYGRAILASPGDGEILSLYGKLIWETQRDESRAKSYFDQAVSASPDDCTVLGSYAHFMWEAEEEDEENKDERERHSKAQVSAAAAMVEAF